MKRSKAKRIPLSAGAAVGLLTVCLLAVGIGLAVSRAGNQPPADSSAEQSTTSLTTTTTTTTSATASADINGSVTENSSTTTTTTTTTPAAPPDSVMLEVPYYSQNGVLPTGCELFSARMVLDYYGVKPSLADIIDKTYAKYTYMADGKNYGHHPNDAFIGSPYDETSFGCFPPVMSKMMNHFLPAGKTAVPLEGESLAELAESNLPNGDPVMVWATMYMKETYEAIGWNLLDAEGNQTDEWYFWPAREHCLVLVGYDAEKYYFNDPMQNSTVVSWSRELVEQRYADMGSRALVVRDTQ